MKPGRRAAKESNGSKEPIACWYVYLLRCADGSLYTGIARDVGRRCRQHNAGTASRYTRGRLPVEVVYEEAQGSRSLALRREAAIKALTRRQKAALIDGGPVPSVSRKRGKA